MQRDDAGSKKAIAPAAPGAAQKPAKPSLGIPDSVVTERQTIVINKVDKFGSAAKAGVLAGDEITDINGARLTAASIQSMEETITKIGVGGTLKLGLIRQGKKIEVAVQLRAKKNLSLDLEEVSETLERKISP
jgi:S1-C subfamily serine protease